MIYLVGGAPRAGKSILGQQVASRLKIGWVSTDLLADLLRVKNEAGIQNEWNAAPRLLIPWQNGSSRIWKNLSGGSAL